MSRSRRCEEGFLRSLCRYGNSPVHLPASASCLGPLVGGRRCIFLRLQDNQEALRLVTERTGRQQQLNRWESTAYA